VTKVRLLCFDSHQRLGYTEASSTEFVRSQASA
jgi:hypothetical protein